MAERLDDRPGREDPGVPPAGVFALRREAAEANENEGVGMSNLLEGAAALWLFACLASAVVGARISLLDRDLMLCALCFVACIGLASVIGLPVVRVMSRRARDDRRPDQRRRYPTTPVKEQS
jgi:hypothetical protein